MAVVVAEALNYLHNDCPHPIIHRDVKSANILLSSDLQPQVYAFPYIFLHHTEDFNADIVHLSDVSMYAVIGFWACHMGISGF